MTAATGTSVGATVMAVTVMATLLTLESIAVALLGVLVAVAIVDCTDVAVDVGTRMLISRTTLPEVTVMVTADRSTPACVAMACWTSVLTLAVKVATSPASAKVN